jgi:outer membrane protein assembly factor BamB
MQSLRLSSFVFVALMVCHSTLFAGDWLTWRGPEYNGISREKGLPDKWTKEGENLLWRNEELATRSTPVVMNGKVYVVCRSFPETTKEGEKVVCADLETGKILWESIHNVFLSDAPAERIGWSSVACDPKSGNVFLLGVGSHFKCLKAETGDVVWEHSMSEKYGMLSTYGGRTNFPMVFEDLVIVSGVTTGWGDYAVPAYRLIAFKISTGEAVWICSTRLRPEDTTYSTPVFTVVDGQAMFVVGAGDGSVYGIQPRTGKVIWTYDASTRGLNTTPLVVGKTVYGSHAERNAADTTVLGAVFAFPITGEAKIPEEKLLWKRPAMAVGRSSPVYVNDRLYYVEDGGTLNILDAKTGEDVAKKKVGRIMFGSPVYADGKIFIAENTGRVYTFAPEDKGVKQLNLVNIQEEIFGSPAVSNGRVLIPSTTALYCIGAKGAKVESDPIPPMPKESPVAQDQTVTQIQIAPVELLLKSGQEAKLEVRGFNKLGQFVKNVDAQLTVAGGGEVKNGVFAAKVSGPGQVAIITAKLGELTATSRARVAPALPWTFDFNDKKVPPTWIGASYRHQPKDFDGESVLVKISTIPKGTRSQAWMGFTDLHDYSVQADFYATEANGKLPSMGLIAQRYTLDMTNKQELQIRSWTSRVDLRFAKTIPFPWSPNQWYTMKFQASNENGAAVLRGKVWKRGEKEPEAWSIEAADATPNTTGSPGLFGNASDAEFYIDNVKVFANK